MVEVGWADWKMLAVAVITLSILISGMFIGVGRAFSNRKIEVFGIEELSQSIINAAILGAVAMLEASLSTIGSSFFLERKCGQGTVAAEWASCTFSNLSGSLFLMLQEIVKVLATLGYYQQLTLDFSVFSIQPLANLSGVSSMLSSQANLVQLLLTLLNLNLQIMIFIVGSGFPLLFAAGLIFRAFFGTRKLGGFLIALALGIFLFYPITVLMFPDPKPAVDSATENMVNFTNNSLYAPWPIVDLNDNYAIAAKLDNLSGWGTINSTGNSTGNLTGDLSSDLGLITNANANALGIVLMFVVIAPLFALLVTLVFIKELGNILGSEMTIPFKIL